MFKNFFKKNVNYCVNQELEVGYKFNSNFNEANRFFVSSYYQCSPVAIATNLIATAIANLDITAIDRKKEYNNEAEIIKRLEVVNQDQTFYDFIEELVLYYIPTGNVFIDVNKVGSSFELILLKPQNITINDTTSSGKAKSILYTSINTIEYNYQDGYYRSRQGNILLCLKGPNISTTDEQFGISLLAPAQLEISQYLNASIHNNSVIVNQCKPSLGFFIEGDYPSDDQIDSIKKTMNEISGNRNAGKPFLFFGKARVEKFSESIKDMDFDRLKKTTTNKIFQCLKIPLPMLNEDTMTFANFSSAQIAFYDNCVLPQAKKIFNFLNHKLLPILGEKQYKLAIDPATINALEQRKIELATAYSQAGSLTRNEIRAMLGYEAVENGDTIYQPQNLVPVGSDRYIEDNRDKPSEKAFFINLMLSQKEYSEEQIQKLATKYFG